MTLFVDSYPHILDDLTHAHPATRSRVKKSLVLRWLAVAVTVLMFLTALWLFTASPSTTVRMTGWAVSTLDLFMLIALATAAIAAHRGGLNRGWGWSSLNEQEVEEFVALAAKYPKIDAVVSDEWLVARASTSLCLRDLAKLRKCVSRWSALDSRRSADQSTANPCV